MTTLPLGNVYLIGAGPGDPDLMTMRGWRLLLQADVVIHDRLIPTELLDHCQPHTEIINVGKLPCYHKIPQPQINQLLVHHAIAGREVVRLKGGDPFVFGRGLEELQACRAAGVPCFVVPGISSSIAAAASVGVPVTSRGVARSFAVITGHTDPNQGDHAYPFDSLAKIDTLVLLMGRKSLAEITAGLMNAGRDPDTPVVSIENATTQQQRAATGTLATIADVLDRQRLSSPIVTVIGDVAALAEIEPTELPAHARFKPQQLVDLIAVQSP